ncbi:HVO_A0114 family putative DNA-binding protein [Paenirhodobacter populi]|uniref:ArsR family transcriptional regulator n=1 Tax=Paenirhodobacter populi TaxID=2306993 RepID=A0A443JN54_9RHOB|nr:ArsR family transcriptional regulator [Sinirhodobacter populi]RWR21894.1 ArsR family transcriptional regulator [Sinirhodobacter populi]
MNTLTIRLSTMSDTRARISRATKLALAGKTVRAVPTLNFASFDHMHRVLASSRIAILRALMGQGVLSICKLADLTDSDVKAVDHDVAILVKAGIVDRNQSGVEFPYDSLHFEFDISLTIEAVRRERIT